MQLYRLTYTDGPFTFRLDVEAEDAGRAQMQGRFALNEKLNPKRGAVSLRGFAGQLAFRGHYELAKVEAL